MADPASGTRRSRFPRSFGFPPRFRFPRRLRFTRAGVLFTLGTVATGGAAIHSGNNLLFLLVGSMLGLIAINGVLSERNLRRVRVERVRLSPASAGDPARIGYQVVNARARLPLVALEVREERLDDPAFLPYLAADGRATAEAEFTAPRRGVHPLGRVTLSTSFPFGLFRKERDVHLPGELVVWPRLGESAFLDPSAHQTGPGRRRRAEVGARSRLGREEYDALRDYRAGDDVRDVHWASSAKRGELVIREFEGRRATPRWLVVDTRTPPGEHAERLLENAARLAHDFSRAGTVFGLIAGPVRIAPATGRRHWTTVMDALARVRFGGVGRRVPLPEGAIVLEGVAS